MAPLPGGSDRGLGAAAGAAAGDAAPGAAPVPAEPCTGYLAKLRAGRFEAHYQSSPEDENLGRGAFGAVTRAVHRGSGRAFAVKRLARPTCVREAAGARGPSADGVLLGHLVGRQRMSDVELRGEVTMMCRLEHVNIVRLVECFEDGQSMYIVMELCHGGELVPFILASPSFTEGHAAVLMRQLLGAVGHMHARRICHRDVKPDNMLLWTQEPLELNTLKLGDFGFACSFVPGETLRERVGTRYYLAPQVADGSYDHKADIWSCGVVLFALLSGSAPFPGDSEAAVLKSVRAGNFVFHGPDWASASAGAKDIVRELLRFDPEARLTAEEALGRNWMQRATAPGGAELRWPRRLLISADGGWLWNPQVLEAGRRRWRRSESGTAGAPVNAPAGVDPATEDAERTLSLDSLELSEGPDGSPPREPAASSAGVSPGGYFAGGSGSPFGGASSRVRLSFSPSPRPVGDVIDLPDGAENDHVGDDHAQLSAAAASQDARLVQETLKELMRSLSEAEARFGVKTNVDSSNIFDAHLGVKTHADSLNSFEDMVDAPSARHPIPRLLLPAG